MKATELRLGNLLTDKTKEVWPVKAISAPIKSWVKPIRLTEEWCVRLGFQRYNNALCKQTEMGEFSIWHPEKDDDFTLNTETFVIQIKTVHQLQNLYFALTGEELQFTK